MPISPISRVTVTFARTSPARWVITSSAIRLASRPARVASSETLPWKRLGRTSAGGWGSVSDSGAGPEPPSPSPVGTGVAAAVCSASSCRRATSGLTSMPAASTSTSVKEDYLSAEQAAIPFGVLVVAVRVGEALVLPGQQPDAGVDGLQQHARLPQARQIEVASEVVDELPDLHVVAAPQGYPVELHPEACAREAGRQQLVALQPARAARSARVPCPVSRAASQVIGSAGVVWTGVRSHW